MFRFKKCNIDKKILLVCFEHLIIKWTSKIILYVKYLLKFNWILILNATQHTFNNVLLIIKSNMLFALKDCKSK